MKILMALTVMLVSATAFAATYDTNIGGSQSKNSNNPVIERNNRQDAINKSDTQINRYKNTPDGDQNDIRRHESERNSQINKR